MGNACGCSNSAAVNHNLKEDAELRRLHALRSTTFLPDSDASHEMLLRKIWKALRDADEPYERVSSKWKDMGFQGDDPLTDVRGGGLLAVECFCYFATSHTIGLYSMIDVLKQRTLEKTEWYYPVATVAIVISSQICDKLGLSSGMRGAVSEENLEALLSSRAARSPLIRFLQGPATTDFTPNRSRSSVQLQWNDGGFFHLFALLLADFHTRFVTEDRTYMDSQQTVTDVVGTLLAHASATPALTPTTLRDEYFKDERIAKILDVQRHISSATRMRAGPSFRGTRVLAGPSLMPTPRGHEATSYPAIPPSASVNTPRAMESPRGTHATSDEMNMHMHARRSKSAAVYTEQNPMADAKLGHFQVRVSRGSTGCGGDDDRLHAMPAADHTSGVLIDKPNVGTESVARSARHINDEDIVVSVDVVLIETSAGRSRNAEATTKPEANKTPEANKAPEVTAKPESQLAERQSNFSVAENVSPGYARPCVPRTSEHIMTGAL